MNDDTLMLAHKKFIIMDFHAEILPLKTRPLIQV